MKKVKKLMATMLTLAISANLLAGCSSANPQSTSATTSSGSAATSSDSVATGYGEGYTLRVAMECAYSPYNWTQETALIDGEELAEPIYGSDYYAYGYDIMIAKQICDYYGWNLEVHKVEWSNIILGLQSNEYDVIIGGMKKTEERDQTVDFTEPYYYSTNCVVVPSGSPYVGATSLEDIRGISSTTQMNTALVPCLQEIPDVKEMPFYSSLSECVMAVTSGAVESCVLSIVNAKIAAQSNDIELIIFDKGKGFSQGGDVCMAVNEGNTELQTKLNEALKALEWNDSKMDEHMDKAVSSAP